METEKIEISPINIAIIGMSGRFPGAKTIPQFWNNLYEGKETLSQFSESDLSKSGVSNKLINDRNYIKVGGVLPDYDKFDNEFFNLSYRDSLLFDPQYRVFLEESWAAFENAGYDILKTKCRVGVFAGAKPSNYLNYYQDITKDKIHNPFEYGFYNEISQLATRVSYEFNLIGPSIYALTACSTSLIVIHLACQSLLIGECDMALAGAITLQAPHIAGYLYQKGMILSSDGHCKPFDASATGTILSTNGVGIIVLKRLDDAIKAGDRIEAIIKATAINNDGKRKVGFAAPSIDGQAETVSAAIDLSNIDPNTISYIETHGTGTNLGDLIEITGLKKAFSGKVSSNYRCYIGSVKSNIGHLDVSAGIAGLIKVVKSMQMKKIPATLHFQSPNPELEIQDSPFVVTNKLTDWHSFATPLRAGISAFGIGGTNAHAILEEAPKHKASNKQKTTNLLTLSAKNNESLNNLKIKFSEYLNNSLENLSDITYTMQTGRHHFPCRIAITFKDIHEAVNKLQNKTQKNLEQKKEIQKIIFMFPGQGSQYINMGYELYNEYYLFRNLIDTCIEKINRIVDFNFYDIIFPNPDDTLSEQKLMETDKTQLALFTIEYALAQFLIMLGIKPTVMIGHSLGEYVAATLAGVFSLDDAISLIYKRGCLMKSTAPGSMLAVFLDEEKLNSLIPPGLSIAAVNGKNLCVISGFKKDIESFSEKLKNESIKSAPLRTSHAFHSALIEPILDKFQHYLSLIDLNEPKIPYSSNLTGKLVKSEEARSPDYWVNHLRHTVKYHKGFSQLVDNDSAIYIELGPGTTLASLAAREFKLQAYHTLPSQTKINEETPLLETIGNLWASGFSINFTQLYTNEFRQKLSLPTYQFLRKCFWPTNHSEHDIVDPGKNKEPDKPKEINDKPINLNKSLKDIWLYYFDKEIINNGTNIFSAGEDSLTATRLLDDINRKFQLDLPISWIYEYPSFDRQLKELITYKETNQNYAIDSLLTVFSKVGNSIPLIFIHPSRAGAEVYREIALKIGKNRTVIGINSYHLTTEDYSVNSIESLAEIYLRELEKLYKQGHIFLAGWSMGGLIAYEMAKKLNKNNKTVLGLYLIDTAVTTTTDQIQYSLKLSNAIKKELRTNSHFIKYPVKLQNQLIKQIEIDNILMKTYHNYEKYFGPVVLYKAKNSIQIENSERLESSELKDICDYFATLFMDKSNGWERYCTNLVTVPIDACHFSILNKTDLLMHMQKDLNCKENLM